MLQYRDGQYTYDDKMKLEMPFAELERVAGTDPTLTRANIKSAKEETAGRQESTARHV